MVLAILMLPKIVPTTYFPWIQELGILLVFFFLWVQKFNTIGIEKWKCENMDLRSENNNKVIAPPFCGMGIWSQK